jgi:PHP family Zn ribbon phosphoesterase
MRYCIDLHNHSCLSSCASDDLLPAVLAMEAADQGIDILALTDHNTGRNLGSFKEACEIVEITPIFGIEITTNEEIHLLALFENLDEAQKFSLYIENLLPKIPNTPKLFGNQIISDLTGENSEELTVMLSNACDISFDALVEEILNLGALAIPAHIDRPSNSVIGNLGFIPPLNYSAVESIAIPPIVNTDMWATIQGSDAHYIEHIGRRRCFIESEKEGFAALVDAFSTKSIEYLK